MKSKDLELVEDRKLLHELLRRHHAASFIGMKIGHEAEQSTTDVQGEYEGHPFTVLGLLVAQAFAMLITLHGNLSNLSGIENK